MVCPSPEHCRFPDRPPDFSSTRMPSITMPLSTALPMSITVRHATATAVAPPSPRRARLGLHRRDDPHAVVEQLHAHVDGVERERVTERDQFVGTLGRLDPREAPRPPAASPWQACSRGCAASSCETRTNPSAVAERTGDGLVADVNHVGRAVGGEVERGLGRALELVKLRTSFKSLARDERTPRLIWQVQPNQTTNQ